MLPLIGSVVHIANTQQTCRGVAARSLFSISVTVMQNKALFRWLDYHCCATGMVRRWTQLPLNTTWHSKSKNQFVVLQTLCCQSPNQKKWLSEAAPSIPVPVVSKQEPFPCPASIFTEKTCSSFPIRWIKVQNRCSEWIDFEYETTCTYHRNKVQGHFREGAALGTRCMYSSSADIHWWAMVEQRGAT